MATPGGSHQGGITMIVLGIETSCDDTSLALFSPTQGVIGDLTAAQYIHEQYGGVVPELASRAHLKTMLPVFTSLLERTGLDQASITGIRLCAG